MRSIDQQNWQAGKVSADGVGRRASFLLSRHPAHLPPLESHVQEVEIKTTDCHRPGASERCVVFNIKTQKDNRISVALS